MEGKEMETLGNVDLFKEPSAGNFGVESTSIFNNTTDADIIFGGGSPAKNPEEVTPIKKTTPKKPQVQTANVTEEVVEEEQENKVDAQELIFGNSTEEVEEAKPENTPEAKEEIQEEPEESVYETLRKDLIKIGIFQESEDETEFESAEQLKDRWIAEKNTAVQNGIYSFLKDKWGDEGIEAFEAMFVHGVSPKEFSTRYAQIENFKEMDLSIESNQEKVYREYYSRLGWSADKIEKKLNSLKLNEELKDEAETVHELLVAQEEEELQDLVAQKAEQEKQRLMLRQQYANNLNKILGEKLKAKEFDGIPVTDKEARETYDYLFTEKWQLPNGEKLTDFDKDILELRKPENHETKVKLALLLRKKLDLTNVKKAAVTKETNELFNLTTRQKVSQKKKNVIPPSKSFLSGL